ncbi:MAG: hypothetical protein ABJA35_12190, partial [Parafilimonas sp.]
FVFYDKQGNTLIEGKFLDDKMNSNWFFYNSSGKLTTEINCKSEEDFTPLLSINESVTVSFLVDNAGKISEIKAENDPGYGTAQEAVRVIKNGPDWQPIQDDKKVIYRQKQTIVFEVTKQ